MTITLWIFQVLLALHTLMGSVWKFSQSAEKTMPSLAVLDGWPWKALSLIEIGVGLTLLLPLLYQPAGKWVPFAFLFLVLEMLLFTGLHFLSGRRDFGPTVYWLVVALICAVMSYLRLRSPG